jgi:hypothetical protein
MVNQSIRLRQVRAAISAVGAQVMGEKNNNGRHELWLRTEDWQRCAASWPFLVRPGSRIDAMGVDIVEVASV